MRISFDLDEVLLVDPRTFETEPPPPFPLNRIYTERLRKGTVRLIHELQAEGFEVWVYTSSFRSEAYIRSLFRPYRIRFERCALSWGSNLIRTPIRFMNAGQYTSFRPKKKFSFSGESIRWTGLS